MPIPTLAAPVNPKSYREYFHKLGEEVLVLAWKARARIRFWNYLGRVDEGTWGFLTPNISLSREAGSPPFRYRLTLTAFFWGIDIGLGKPKKLVSEVIATNSAPPFTYVDEYHADEANERP